MTQAQRDTIGGWWDRTKEIITFATGIVVLLGALYAVVVWASGGLQLGSQVDMRDVKTQLATIQADQVKAAQAAKDAQTSQASQAASASAAVQTAQDKIIARLDALPRPSDYTNQETHLHDLDARVDTLRDNTVKLRADVDNLMRPTAFRNPRCPTC